MIQASLVDNLDHLFEKSRKKYGEISVDNLEMYASVCYNFIVHGIGWYYRRRNGFLTDVPVLGELELNTIVGHTIKKHRDESRCFLDWLS
ncbi:hypothetical protein H8E77_13745 [bacterium]|nr:hypothetical protein [bacterium]